MNHFTDKELKCKGSNCCGNTVVMDSEFMLKLNLVRKLYGRPMFVTSGFRCDKHNAEIGGAENSNHTKGRAVDVTVKDRDFSVLKAFADVFFSEVIIYTDKNFIHIGDD